MKRHVGKVLGFALLFVFVPMVCAEQEQVTAVTGREGGIVRCREGVKVVLAGDKEYTIEPDVGFVKVPAGEYYIKRWIIKQSDEEGALWYLRGNYKGRAGSIKIADGQDLQLSVGDTAGVILTVSRSKEGYRFDLDLTGQAGESVEFYQNDKRSSPVLKVWSEKGTYEERFKFSYG